VARVREAAARHHQHRFQVAHLAFAHDAPHEPARFRLPAAQEVGGGPAHHLVERHTEQRLRAGARVGEPAAAIHAHDDVRGVGGHELEELVGPLHLVVQARVVDGGGGLVGQSRQHRLVVLAEAAAGARIDVDEAFHRVAHPDGDRQRGHDALRAHEVQVVAAEGRVVRAVVRALRPAGVPGHAAQSLASLDADGVVVPIARAHPVPEGHRVGGGVAQRDAREIGAGEVARRLADPLQHRVEVERRVDRLHELREDVALAQPLFRLPPQLQREAHLRGHALEQAQLDLRGGAPARPPDEEEPAHERAVGDRGREERRVRRQHAHVGHPARVGDRVHRPYGLEGFGGREQRVAGGDAEGGIPEPVHALLGHVIAAHGDERLRGIDAVCAHHVGGEGARHFARDQAHGVGSGQAQRQRARHRQQGLRLLETADELDEVLRVAGLGAHGTSPAALTAPRRSAGTPRWPPRRRPAPARR
jgi:hypothetical protein